MLQPALAQRIELGALPAGLPGRDELVRVVEAAQTDPLVSSAALLQRLSGAVSEKLLGELAGELLQWDEEDFALEEEFEGVLRQLNGASQQKEVGTLLQLAQERGLAALTPEQREQLQQFRRSGAAKEQDSL